MSLETSDFARVAKIFYTLALRVCTAQSYFHCNCVFWFFFYLPLKSAKMSETRANLLLNCNNPV